MKTPVSDAAVAEYADRIRAGYPLGELFPARMSDCDFTEPQRKSAKAQLPSAVEAKKPTKVPLPVTAGPPTAQKPKALSKLRKMLYLQSGRCFFCGEPLKDQEASIEHLNPKSRGGTSTEDNEVVCHASLNETFGGMDLKRKFAFVLRTAGSFKCPKK
jgi:hypothetical protein